MRRAGWSAAYLVVDGQHLDVEGLAVQLVAAGVLDGVGEADQAGLGPDVGQRRQVGHLHDTHGNCWSQLSDVFTQKNEGRPGEF